MNTKLSRRARLLVGIGAGAVLLGVTATACGSSPTAAPAPSTATTTSTTAPTTTSPAPIVVDSTAPKPPGSTAAKPAPVPTLGQVWSQYQKGYGTVRPNVIDNGGDGNGVVTDVKWQSWGGPTAIATGIAADASDPSKPLAEAPETPATVQAFDLGMCDGKLMYRAVEWYFPSDGGKFNPKAYQNICTGDYVGSN